MSTDFKETIRLTGSKKDHQLNFMLKLRMKYGGPRYAAMGRKVKK